MTSMVTRGALGEPGTGAKDPDGPLVLWEQEMGTGLQFLVFSTEKDLEIDLE